MFAALPVLSLIGRELPHRLPAKSVAEPANEEAPSGSGSGLGWVGCKFILLAGSAPKRRARYSIFDFRWMHGWIPQSVGRFQRMGP